MDVCDVTFIGAGPAGLFGAFYAGLRDLRARIIEALPQTGGQLSVLYPEKYIYDAPGFVKILAKDLVKSLTQQAMQFNPDLHLNERVISLKRKDDTLIHLTTDSGEYLSRTVVIAGGVGAFAPNRLNTPGVEKYEGRGVFYHIADKSSIRGKRLLIIGGGDSAVDWALNLKDTASKVTLIHRRDVFRAHEGSVKELFSSSIDVRLFHELKNVYGDGEVKAATICNNKNGVETQLEVDAVLLCIGFKADLGPIREWGLKFTNRYVEVDKNMETSIAGVFAVGDIAAEPGRVKLNLIAECYAQAAVAVNVIKKRLDPSAPIYEHSSEKSLPTPPAV